jgi:TrmH family RNA methyltransferase
MVALKASAKGTLFTPKLHAVSGFVVGSEGGGVSPELLAISQQVSIPTEGVESLNAAVACSIALFEAARQRGIR